MRRALIAAAVVALSVGVVRAAAAGSPISDRQAIAFLSGKGSLPAISGGKTMPLPQRERAYAVRAYKAGPYKKPALNLFYATGATAAHYMSKKDREDGRTALALLGRSGLADQIAQSVKHPKTVTRFGVTVRQYAEATARGLAAGLLD